MTDQSKPDQMLALVDEIERLRGENATLRTEKHADAEAIGALRKENERLETRIRSLDHALNFILSDAAWTPKHPSCESIINRINALRKGDADQ